MKPAFLAAAFLLTGHAGAHAAPVIPVNDVAEICEAGFGINTTNAASAARKTTCVAYLDAVIATTVQIGALADPKNRRALFCLPEGVAYDQLAKTFVQFARRNKDYGNRAAASVVMAAYADRYPCK